MKKETRIPTSKDKGNNMVAIKDLRFLNKNVVKVFEALVEKVEASTKERGGDVNYPYGVFENKPFMPLNVEKIFDGGKSFCGYPVESFAISHTFVHNGDLMRDPEVVFGVIEVEGEKKIFPYSFRNDNLNRFVKSVSFQENAVDVRGQADLVEFSNIFLRNIKEQGFLKIEPQESIKYEEDKE